MVEYVKVCSNCGSRDIEPSRNVGYVPGLTGNERYFCRSCGQESVPLLIDESKVENENKDGFYKVAMVPVDTANTKLENIVSEIQWDGNEYVTTDNQTIFEEYKSTIRNNRCSNTIILDLIGIKTRHPNYKILKNIVKPKYNIWLDIGIHNDEDIFDAFTLDAGRVICSSICVSSVQVYEEAFDLSDHILPCICTCGDKVQWKSSANETDLFRVIESLKRIGYEEIIIIDLDCLGKNKVPDKSYASRISETFSGIIFGGGVREEDVTDLKNLKLRGVILDPEFN